MGLPGCVGWMYRKGNILGCSLHCMYPEHSCQWEMLGVLVPLACICKGSFPYLDLPFSCTGGGWGVPLSLLCSLEPLECSQ